MSKPHFFQGEWISDEELTLRLESLDEIVARSAPIEASRVAEASTALSSRLTDPASAISQALANCLVEEAGVERELAITTLRELAGLLTREALEGKLVRELGSREPQLIARVTPRAVGEEGLFEAWAPLGLLVHISPQNSLATGAMSALEGLLAGNFNFLKTGGSESRFPQLFLEALASLDPSRAIEERTVAARIPSSRTDLLSRVFGLADGIAAWGGESTIDGIRRLAPPHVRLIEWGHRISFVYVTPESAGNEALCEAIALECCLSEQRSCSSPQCVYLDSESWDEVHAFAERLAQALKRVSPTLPRELPDDSEAAEISMVTACHKLESAFGRAALLEDEGGQWRILVDAREALTPSPLYRTVWVKPLPRAQLTRALRPMRRYLQTTGLACGLQDAAELSAVLIEAGAARIRVIGRMQESYTGEPHDGVYALQRYSRRVSVQLPEGARGISSFDELREVPGDPRLASQPITPKEAFEDHGTGTPQLYFKSGGSSGEPKLSTFSYDQYDADMWLGAEGLFAAGLDPARDRAINLFFSGGLYGGFLSIFSALERLRIVQFPMAAAQDLESVAKIVIEQRINSLLGMPSYLMRLFEKNAAALERYRGVEKIFYGGEHFTDAQRALLSDRFGVRLIRSGAYGSVDIGPMGYSCEHSEPGVHHLQQRLHRLEILRLDQDSPVTGAEVGRLVFSPRSAASNKPSRYAIGDVGHWVPEICPCGRRAPRFRLLGRTGDIFRIGSSFLNFQKFAALVSSTLGYAGELQLCLELDERGLKERVVLRIAQGHGLTAQRCRDACLAGYADLREVVLEDGTLLFEVEELDPSAFARSPASGKLLRVIDRRARA